MSEEEKEETKKKEEEAITALFADLKGKFEAHQEDENAMIPLNKSCMALMDKIAKGINSNQIRNIYKLIKNVDKDKAFSANKFTVAQQKLAYMQGRIDSGKNEKAVKLIQFLRDSSAGIDKKQKFSGYLEMLTALVAYHKLYNKN